MHHGTCVTHVPWCMSGSLTCGDGKNVPGIPGACAPGNLRIWQEAHWIESLETFGTSAIFEVLQRIDVSANNIRSFNVSNLRHMPQLYDLNLYANKITHFEDFRNFSTETIHLGDNPWHCGAAISWLRKEYMEFERDLTCATPDCLHNRIIADMSKFHVVAQCTEFDVIADPSQTKYSCYTILLNSLIFDMNQNAFTECSCIYGKM